jgi:anion-transporting  ArsA/GET3 family ATPase
MRWFVDAFQSTGKLSLNLIAKSAAVVLKGIGKITGGGFLEAMAQLITQLNDLFGGFKERAQAVQRALRAPEVAFVLVTSPAPPSIQEVLYFSDRLAEHSMPRSAFVVNRVHLPPHRDKEGVTEDQAAAAIRARGIALEDEAPTRVVQAHHGASRLAALDARHLEALASHGVPVVRLAELAADVHDLALLSELADVLVAGGV